MMTRLDDPDPCEAHAQALDDLAGGAGGLAVVFAGAVGGMAYLEGRTSRGQTWIGVRAYGGRLSALSWRLHPAEVEMLIFHGGGRVPATPPLSSFRSARRGNIIPRALDFRRASGDLARPEEPKWIT
jgi:hypothetical protein